jgi:hypothetical protein
MPEGIAHDERIAVADQAAERVAAVPLLRRPRDDARHVEVLADPARQFIPRDIALAQEAVDVLVFLIEEEADLLEDRLGVGGEDRMLAHRDQRSVQLLGVGQVEIAAQRQVARRPRTPAEKRVARGDVVPAAGAVPQVAHQQFAAEVELLLHRVGELGMDDALGDVLIILAEQHAEDAVEGVRLDVPFAEQVRRPGGHIELYAGHSGAVLAAVVLLLHQEEKLGEAPQR